jgi:hypothetical protein
MRAVGVHWWHNAHSPGHQSVAKRERLDVETATSSEARRTAAVSNILERVLGASYTGEIANLPEHRRHAGAGTNFHPP